MQYLAQLVELIQTKNLLPPLPWLPAQTFHGFSKQELDDLQRGLGYRLPQAYLEFLSICGHYTGCMWVGSDIALSDAAGALRRQCDAKKILLEAQKSPDLFANHFTFMIHHGYQCFYFPLDGNSDPPVWLFTLNGEGNPITRAAATLTEFLLTEAQIV